MAITIGNSNEQPQATPIVPEVTEPATANPVIEVQPTEIEVQPTIEVGTQVGSSPVEQSVENTDPNKIVATVFDHDTPIVVLCGPPSCGKTMTLVRLSRYLHKNGYVVAPEPSFRPANDENYKIICRDFNKLLNATSAAEGTNAINFLLVKVFKDGRPICQILEAPGEHYFNPRSPFDPYPPYLQTIFACQNRKSWIFFIEPNWQNGEDRRNYVTRLLDLKTKARGHDRTVFLFNKIDLTRFVISPGVVNMTQAKKYVSDMYEGIFAAFKNPTPIYNIFKPYLCDFIPYQTGTYTDAVDGTKTFVEGPEEYTRILWNSIMRSVKG